MTKQAKDSRIDWLENKLSDKTREIMEKHEEFETWFAKFIEGDTQ